VFLDLPSLPLSLESLVLLVFPALPLFQSDQEYLESPADLLGLLVQVALGSLVFLVSPVSQLLLYFPADLLHQLLLYFLSPQYFLSIQLLPYFHSVRLLALLHQLGQEVLLTDRLPLLNL
jgi:hypothetical protein